MFLAIGVGGSVGVIAISLISSSGGGALMFLLNNL